MKLLKTAFDKIKTKFSKKSKLTKEERREIQSFWAFWILAIVPLVTPDIILRYFTEGISYGLGYHLLASAFSLFWIILLAFFCIVLLNKRIGRIVYMIAATITTIWFFANFVYYDVTGSYLMFDSVGMISEATGYLNVVGSHLTPSVIIGFLLCITCLVFAFRLWPENNYSTKKRLAMCIIPIVGLIAVRVTVIGIEIYDSKHQTADPWDKLSYEYKNAKDTPKIMNMTGFYQYTIRSIMDNVSSHDSYSEEEIAEVREFFDNKPVEPNEKTGMLAGKNVIFVMMESMDDWMINPKYTPTISMMMENGINFSDNYSPTRGTGFTFSSEFCLNTGFYCPTGRASAVVFNDKPFIHSMANAFTNAGYVSRSFHYNTGTFYDRAVMHNLFGYKNYNSFLDYMVYKDAILDSMAISNDELYADIINPGAKCRTTSNTNEQEIEDIGVLPDFGGEAVSSSSKTPQTSQDATDGSEIPDSQKPFFDFLITYSAHLPYKDDDFKSQLIVDKYPNLLDPTLNPVVGYAQLFAHDTDEFFRILLEKLEASGQLENTVIVAFTDHYSYGIKDKSIMSTISKVAGSTIYEKTPFFIYAPWLKHESVNKVSSTCDVLPTLENLFGLERTRYTIGNDVYDAQNDGFMFFANNSWYDGHSFYNSKKANDEVELDQESQDRIFANCERSVKLNRINDFCVETGLYAMTEDEIAKFLAPEIEEPDVELEPTSTPITN